jgi:phosphate transport system permease protein
MSTTLEPTPIEPSPFGREATPTTPWKTPRHKKAQGWLNSLALAILAGLITLFTGVAGVDGWAFVFFFLTLITVVVRHWRAEVKQRKDAVMSVVITSLSIAAFVPWLSIFFSLIQNGYKAIYLGYFTSDMRVTGPDDDLNFGGVGHAIVGSLIMVLIATVVTLPLGILSGMYLSEIRGRFSFLVRFVVQSMSGVPSIVAGLFIYATVVIPMGKYSGLAGSAALAVLMLPTVARTSEEVLKLVPDDLRTAGYALGSRQWRTAVMIVLPTVRSGLVTAAILGIARVVGETAPLILTSLYASNFQFNPVEGPIAALPTYVFGLLKLGTEYAIARAWAGSLVLMVVVAILFAIARFVGNRGPRA